MATHRDYKNQLHLKSPSAAVGNRNALTARTSVALRSVNTPASSSVATAESGVGVAASMSMASALPSGPPSAASDAAAPASPSAAGAAAGAPVRMNRTKWQSVINDQKLRRDLDDAIELDDLAQIRTILERKPKLAHAPNEDGLLAVDLAILLERFTVAKVLMQSGAVHSDLLYDFATLEAYVARLQDDAALNILQLTARMFSSPQIVKGFDKDLRVLDRRHRRLKTIRTYLTTLSPPPPPAAVTCEVRSDCSVRVLLHSAQESSAILALRYKIEWSERADFADRVPQCAVVNSTQGTVSHLIGNLQRRRTYFLRAQLYSLRGWSAYAYPKSRYIVLSCWTDLKCTPLMAEPPPERHSLAARLALEHNSDEYAATFLMEFDKLFCAVTKSKSPLVCKRPAQETSPPPTLAPSATPSLASASSTTLATVGTLTASNLSLSSIGIAAAPTAAATSGTPPASAASSQKETAATNGFRWFTSSAATYKLSKTVKRGTYLCFVIYNDCRIASTADEILPLIQVDEQTPNTNLNNELAALQKYVTDIHLLKMVLKCLSRLSIPGSLEFRIKTLNIIADFLSALEPAASPPSGTAPGCSSVQSFSVCMSNRIITNATHRDAVIFVCCVNCDACGKDAALPSGLKWCPYTRLLRRRPAYKASTLMPVAVTPSGSSQNLISSGSPNCVSSSPLVPPSEQQIAANLDALQQSLPLSDAASRPTLSSAPSDPRQRMSITSSMDDQADIYSCLLTRLDDIVTCAKRLGEPLPCGLYLAYVKVRTTVDQMRLVCTKQQPLIIPTVKLRDNPHVTKEEWASLHRLKASEPVTNDYEASVASNFRDALLTAATKLHKLVFASQGQPECPLNHSLYINEVVELNDQVSLILLIPPLDEVFAVSSSLDLSVNSNRTSHLTEMHLANFEILCAQIYGTSKQQRAIALLSAIDLCLSVVQHVQRSMLNTDEVRAIKNGCEKILSIHGKLEEFWRAHRWLIDILGKVRDRSKRNSVLTLLPLEVLQNTSLLVSSDAPVQSSSTPDDNSTLNSAPNAPALLPLTEPASEMPPVLDAAEVLEAQAPADIATRTQVPDSDSTQDPSDSLERAVPDGTAVTSSDNDSAGSQSETEPTIKVYIAYYAGLDNEAANLTVRLAPGMTVRDIINTVIQRVNHLARASNPENPCYSDEELESFYMVVLAASKERVLPASCCPIDLPAPLRNGRFYISRRVKELKESVETML